MTRQAVIHLAAAFSVALAASSAHAHHSHVYFYDQCKSITVEGPVESVQFKDPHTLIILRAKDGTAYTVDWKGMSALTTAGTLGPAKAALVSGARIAVTGRPIRTGAEIREHSPEYTHEPNPRTVDPTLIRRVGDGWSWAAPPIQNPPDCKGK